MREPEYLITPDDVGANGQKQFLLDHTGHGALCKGFTDFSEVDKHDVAQGVLCVLGDAYPSGAALKAHPGVFCVIFIHSFYMPL